jgi:hypothetical protein
MSPPTRPRPSIPPPDRGTQLSRRLWLGASLQLLLPALLPAQTPGAKNRSQSSTPAGSQAEPSRTPRTTLNNHEATAIEAVRVRARRNQITDQLHVDQTENYIGVGNAPPAFRKKALELCEALARDYLQHFRFRSFDVNPPEDRLVLVILADAGDFARYLGEDVPDLIRGIYELGDNRLVIYDQRSRNDNNPQSERINTIALMHEGTHQLTYNTGLLNRKVDTPHLVSEGLGVYGEVRRPDGKTKIGTPNLDRLELLRQQAQFWIPLPQLLENDPFTDPERQQRAYAQAWVFTHYHLSDPERRNRYKAYLATIREGRQISQRLQDAADALGDLATLDSLLKRYAARFWTRR